MLQSTQKRAKLASTEEGLFLEFSNESFTKEDVTKLFCHQKRKCANSKTNIELGYHIDHIYPIFLGGSNSRRKIQLLCPTCNCSKGCKDPINWAIKNGKLL